MAIPNIINLATTNMTEVRKMIDYKKMYAILCTAASEALDALPDTETNAEDRGLLQAALLTAEELYVSQADDGA